MTPEQKQERDIAAATFLRPFPKTAARIIAIAENAAARAIGASMTVMARYEVRFTGEVVECEWHHLGATGKGSIMVHFEVLLEVDSKRVGPFVVEKIPSRTTRR